MPAGAKSSSLEVTNDAVAYGVSIVPAPVGPGETFWKVIRIHHLTPQENNGNHNVYVDVVDEKDQRVLGTQISLKWPSGSGTGVIDKPPNEPGTNFPIWKNQICEIEVLGKPSDRVVNLSTDHPDEQPPGNSVYHHSFFVLYKLAYLDVPNQADLGVIEGTVKRGSGMKIVLQKDSQQVAATTAGPDERYRFEKLGAGVYSLSVEGTAVSVKDINMDGKSVLVVDMDLGPGPEPPQSLVQYVLFGPVDAPGTRTNFALAMDYVLRKQSACGFRVEEALKAKAVIIVGDVRAVSAADEARLVRAGCQVRRVSGDSYAVEVILAQLP
jgi:hypothetical protein